MLFVKYFNYFTVKYTFVLAVFLLYEFQCKHLIFLKY